MILDALVDEHRRFMVMLSVLESMAKRLGRRGKVPAAMITDVLDFFENICDRHHAREERVLFPVMARHGVGKDQTVVSALLAQHEAGRAYCRKMRADQARLANGDERAAADLAAHALGYCELIREHIRIEDEYFYGMADQLLTATEQQDIVAQFSGVAGSSANPETGRFLRMLEEYPEIVASWK